MRPIIKCLFFTLFIVNIIVTSCSKGEDDPAISLRTREARVVGKWIVKEYKTTDERINPDNPSSNSITTFNAANGNFEETKVNSSGTLTNKGTYISNLEFKKDGSFTSSIKRDNDVVNTSGTWNFSSNVGDAKNKSELLLKVTNYSTPTSNLTGIGVTYEKYELKELRNKRMVWVNNNSGSSNYFNNQSNMQKENFRWEVEIVLEQ